jgi:FHS family L-fucose permease-like MFS transporter
MVWTFIIQYAGQELGLSKATAQGYNMAAMAIFVTSRFICTFLLKYIKPSILLTALAVGGGAFTLGAIVLHGMAGLYSLIAVSACMSLMFPTIYGIALHGLGDDAKLASAGLIVAIGGGCLMPPLQGLLIDKATWFGDALSAVRVSFFLPLICFAVIAAFGWWVKKQEG